MTIEQDKLFKKEVRTMLSGLRNTTAYTIEQITGALANEDEMKIRYSNIGLCRGITEPFYESLNGKDCKIIFNKKMYKPQVLSTGKFRRDDNGELVKDYVPVPQECIVIKSPVNIKLRRTLEDGTVYKEKKDFVYLYRTRDGDYLYIVPRTFVYRRNKLVYTISDGNRVNHFGAVKVACTDGKFRYISLLDSSRTNAQLKGVVEVIENDKDVKTVLEGIMFELERRGIIFNVQTGYVQQEDIDTNVFYQYQQPTLDVATYTSIGSSLEKETDVEDLQ